MAKGKPTRGRPRLAPEENETRERILAAAQTLFAEKGFSKVTLRELTQAADSNLAAVNYYFGSKDQLLVALVKRAAKIVNRERTRLLQAAIGERGSRKQKIRRILHALVAPAVAVTPGAESAFLYNALLNRAIADGPPELSDLLLRQTSHLAPYAQELAKLLPELTEEDIYWRLHFILNIEHATHTELDRLSHLSGGICDISDRPAMVKRIVDFALAGLLAARNS